MFDAVKVKNDCVQWIRDWFDKNGPGCNAIIGISGGKDSTVAAALCVEALGADRVYGILIPNGEQPDFSDAHAVVHCLGIEHYIINIHQMFEDLTTRIKLQGIDIKDQTKINLPPRLRMATLYAISQSLNGRVVCTDNASEAYIGYSTRWGDNVGDFSPLLNLTSEEVVAIGDALGLPYDLVHKTPSDGLCGKTDEDNFGFTYATLNRYIREGVCEDKETRDLIERKHRNNMFKQEPIPSFPYYPADFIDEVLL